MNRHGHTVVAPLIVAWLLAQQPDLLAHPHEMTDGEMDQVCAKETTGVDLDPVVIGQIFVQFERMTSIGQVTGHGTVTAEIIPDASHSAAWPQSSRAPVPAASAMVASGSGSLTISGSAVTSTSDLQPVTVRVEGATVRITTDMDINVQTLPGALNVLNQNRLVLPSAVIAPSGMILGGTR